MKLLRHLVLVAAVLAPAAAISAQSQCGPLPPGVVPVNNTGCPGYVTPCFSGTPRIGQTVQISWLVRPAPRSTGFVLVGFPSGGGITFNPPVACAAGCVLYAAPISGIYFVATDTLNPTLTLAIPNDLRLTQQAFTAQAGLLSGLANCFDLSQAASFVPLR